MRRITLPERGVWARPFGEVAADEPWITIRVNDPAKLCVRYAKLHGRKARKVSGIVDDEFRRDMYELENGDRVRLWPEEVQP